MQQVHSFERSPAMDQNNQIWKCFFKVHSNCVLLSPPPLPPPPPPQGQTLSLENAEFSAGDIGDFGTGRNLRPTKTPQAEISGRKLLRPKPLESVPQFFFAPPSPPPLQIKFGWAFTVNCSGINPNLWLEPFTYAYTYRYSNVAYILNL